MATQLQIQSPGNRSKRRGPASRWRIVNVRLLVTTVVVIGISVPMFLFWYRYQVNQTAHAFLNRAAQLEENAQWKEAAANLARYLQFHPDNVEQRLRLVTDLSRVEPQTPRSRRRLTVALYEVLGLAPDRHDMRLLLADNLLQLRQFTAAQELAEDVRNESNNADEQRSARRIIAMAMHAQTGPGGRVRIEDALSELARAAFELPGDIELVSLVASVCRENPGIPASVFQEIPGIDTNVEQDAATVADQVMDRLVDVRQNADALMARYQYRVKHGLAGADRDLQNALAIAPNHVDGLLAAAATELNAGPQGDPLKAEELLRRVIEIEPRDSRGYTALARLLSASQDRDGAKQVLQQGRKKVGTDNPDINAQLLTAYLKSNELDAAQAILTDLDAAIRRRLPEVSTPIRLNLENYLRLQHSQLALARGEFQSAVRNLKAVITVVGRGEQLTASSARFQAQVLLAETMGDLGRWDLAADYWKALTAEMELQRDYWDELPADVSAKKVYLDRYYLSGRAFLQAGRPQESIAQLEKHLESSSTWQAEATVLLLRSHYLHQLRRTASERSWSEFQTLLRRSQQQLPEEPELVILQSDYLAAQGNENARRAAVMLLRSEAERFSNDKDYWASLAARFQQLGHPADAKRALERYAELESDANQSAFVRAALLARANRFDEADQVLSSLSSTGDATDRSEITLQRLQLFASAGRLADAQQLVTESLVSDPENPKLLVAGIEIALDAKELDLAERWEQELADLARRGVADDYQWRFLRARRLLDQFATLDVNARRELAQEINSLRTERPRWHPIVSLSAEHTALIGSPRQAISKLELALALGDNRVKTLERLATLLKQAGRIEEAQKYLTRLFQAESLAISTAVEQKRIQEALELAQQSVERHPEDALPRIWLADLLVVDGQVERAETILRESLSQLPNDLRVTDALILFLARNNRAEEARELVEALGSQLGGDETGRHFSAAKGYELLGDADAARVAYQAAIDSEPDNIEMRVRYANFLMSNDVTAAREQYAAILRLDLDNVTAKRQMATLLATSGDEDDWNRAVQLLRATDGVSSSQTVENQRLRAILLSRRGKSRAERLDNLAVAHDIFAELLASAHGVARDADRLLLAGILQQKALLARDVSALSAARDQLLLLVDREQTSAEYLRRYVQFLLRSAESPLVEKSTDAAAIRKDLLSDARLRMDKLESLVRDQDAGSAATVETVRLLARLLSAEDQQDEAARVLREFGDRWQARIATDAERAKYCIAMGQLYSSIGEHSAAEESYRRLMTMVPNGYIFLARALAEQDKVEQAAELCLRVATENPSAESAAALAQMLIPIPSDHPILQRANPVITSALETHGNNVDLLMSVAAMHTTRNNNEQAIDLFQRTVQHAPRNAMALNNLATLLGERPNRRKEALDYVDRAMNIAGRTPALLDTRGTILVHDQRYDEAVACLQEATAGGAEDPRYFFHLALAYQGAGKDKDARDALRSSRELGLKRAILTERDRKQMADLQQQLLINETAVE